MAVEQQNLKICRVPAGVKNLFKQSVPSAGSLYFDEEDKRVIVGDGSTAGGIYTGAKYFSELEEIDDVALNSAIIEACEAAMTSTEAASIMQYGGVRYDLQQVLSDAQKNQARSNINAELAGNCLPLTGGRMTGQMSRDSGGSWISGRDNAVVRQVRSASNSWNPVCSVKTPSGNWTIGNVGDGESLQFSYDTDTNYYAGNNTNTYVNITSGGVFSGTASTANWADLAEKYKADKEYDAGTLIKFGGEAEIMLADSIVNGVVSEKPGFLLNNNEEGIPVALEGRVRVKVIGAVNKFDKIVLDPEHPGVGKVRTSDESDDVVIARALETNSDESIKLVLCATKFNLE